MIAINLSDKPFDSKVQQGFGSFASVLWIEIPRRRPLASTTKITNAPACGGLTHMTTHHPTVKCWGATIATEVDMCVLMLCSPMFHLALSILVVLLGITMIFLWHYHVVRTMYSR